MLSAVICCVTDAQADTGPIARPQAEINCRYPESSTEIILPIGSPETERRDTHPRRLTKVRAYVERPGGGREYLRDENGAAEWSVEPDVQAGGQLSFKPDRTSYSGKIRVTLDGRPAPENGPLQDQPPVLEKVLEHRFEDGARIKVHYTDQILDHAGERQTFPGDVLDAAVTAYQTITEFLGFDTQGYSFARPDTSYAYDADRTVDIYLGAPDGPDAYLGRGFDQSAFRDAPCFDTLNMTDTRYEAIVLLPVRYGQFIRSWEKINPSPLGTRTVDVDLRGTLIHEMLHVILFYYNKNIDKKSHEESADGINPRKTDWYVEGLARYIETFAGARHDFYSQGFKQALPDKIRFSRGGTNYFMRYPDQAFTELRYENALFWRHIDYRYGMEAIERISREFRGGGKLDAKLSRILGKPFVEVIEDFCAAVYEKDFGLKDDSVYLLDIAATRLDWRDGSLWMKDGYGQEERSIGQRCRTDWIGSWGEFKARLDEASVAGDATPEADVSAQSSDFVRIAFTDKPPAKVGVRNLDGEGALTGRIYFHTRGGSQFMRRLGRVAPGARSAIDLDLIAADLGLSRSDFIGCGIIVINPSPEGRVAYEVLASP